MTDAETQWTEVQVLVPVHGNPDVYLAAMTATCLALSPGGFVMEGDDAPPGDREPPPPGSVRVLLYVEEDAFPAAREHLEASLVDYPGATLAARPLDPDCRDRWKKWFKGFVVSPRLGVRPPWEADPAGLEPDAVVIEIEPGMAFGTGQHETTHLCLEALDQLGREGRGPDQLLDVGCGTGILAIAAARLWGAKVVGVDVDEAAVRCARENLPRNGVGDRVRLETTPLREVPGRYPLVIANIIAPVLLAIAEDVVAHVSPGGTLLLSGVLDTQREEIVARYGALGASVVATAQRGEWLRLHLEVPG